MLEFYYAPFDGLEILFGIRNRHTYMNSSKRQTITFFFL